MKTKRADDDASQEKIIILISSLLAWDATPRNLEAVQSPQDQDEEAAALKAAKIAAEKPAEGEAVEE